MRPKRNSSPMPTPKKHFWSKFWNNLAQLVFNKNETKSYYSCVSCCLKNDNRANYYKLIYSRDNNRIYTCRDCGRQFKAEFYENKDKDKTPNNVSSRDYRISDL